MSDLPVSLPERLTKAAAALYGVRRITRSNDSEMVEARHAMFYVLHQYGWSDTRIARRYKINHSTVLHARKAAPGKMETNRDFALAVHVLQRVAEQWKQEMER